MRVPSTIAWTKTHEIPHLLRGMRLARTYSRVVPVHGAIAYRTR